MKRNLMLAVLLLSALLLAACGGGPSAEDIPDTVEYTIEMYDGEEFKFEPDTLELWVGQEVTLHFVNMGEKDHEFMVGQDVNFDPGYPNAFHTDFFEDVEPVVVQGMAMRDDQMIMAMGDDMDMEEDMDMGEEGDMDMEDDHDEGEDDHAEDEDDHAEEEGMDDMAMEEDDHSEDEAAHDDDHHGYMVMATQDQPESTITFTVTEDMVGEWEFGCFEDDGQHYDDGMKGELVVHEAPSS